MLPSTPHLILASRSPRRAELLRQAGYAFTQVDPPFDDPPQPAPGFVPLSRPDPPDGVGTTWERVAATLRGAPPGEGTSGNPGVAASLARRIARAKADSLRTLPLLVSGRPVVAIAADTIVVAPDGRLLGQAPDAAAAKQMLLALICGEHRVVTGVALFRFGPEKKRCQEPSHPDRKWFLAPFLRRTHVDIARVRLGKVSARDLRAYLDSGDWRGKAGAYNLSELESRWPFTVTGDPTTVVGLPMRWLAAALAAWAVRPQHPGPRAKSRGSGLRT